MSQLETAARRALQALELHTRGIGPDEPFAGAILLCRHAAGLAADPTRLLQHWAGQTLGSEVSSLRFPWVMDHERYVKLPAYAGNPENWTAWRASESDLVQQQPFKAESKLSHPLVLTHNGEILLQSGHQELLATVLPRIRRDLAAFVEGANPWTDTFALWCMTMQPRLFHRMRPIALAVAMSYVENASANGGVVRGARFPFRGHPLASASAHLAHALLHLGLDFGCVSGLVQYLTGAQRDGGWGDGDDPPDVLTTLAAAELLAGVTPNFSLEPVLNFLLSRQEEAGWWSALGPERPWLTWKVLSFLKRSQLPFAHRFGWPPCEPSELDPKTGLPRFSYFVSLAELLGRLPGLAQSELELGFLDLAKFKKFNDSYGQDEGDRVLRVLAEHLIEDDQLRTVRDGGDEYLILGAPTGQGLAKRLERLRHSWPQRFRKEFGDEPTVVAPRILVTRVAGGGLMKAREKLGQGITGLKDEIPGPEGILKTVKL